jgi:hypothetical protein
MAHAQSMSWAFTGTIFAGEERSGTNFGDSPHADDEAA